MSRVLVCTRRMSVLLPSSERWNANINYPTKVAAKIASRIKSTIPRISYLYIFFLIYFNDGYSMLSLSWASSANRAEKGLFFLFVIYFLGCWLLVGQVKQSAGVFLFLLRAHAHLRLLFRSENGPPTVFFFFFFSFLQLKIYTFNNVIQCNIM